MFFCRLVPIYKEDSYQQNCYYTESSALTTIMSLPPVYAQRNTNASSGNPTQNNKDASKGVDRLAEHLKGRRTGRYSSLLKCYRSCRRPLAGSKKSFLHYGLKCRGNLSAARSSPVPTLGRVPTSASVMLLVS